MSLVVVIYLWPMSSIVGFYGFSLNRSKFSEPSPCFRCQDLPLSRLPPPHQKDGTTNLLLLPADIHLLCMSSYSCFKVET